MPKAFDFALKLQTPRTNKHRTSKLAYNILLLLLCYP